MAAGPGPAERLEARRAQADSAAGRGRCWRVTPQACCSHEAKPPEAAPGA
ncbi:MAG TPA: hypothetical protein VGN83_19980 [Falsiroseomonas sp.]|nr:hypothetical protein [Falsiroseomonas sp.]